MEDKRISRRRLVQSTAAVGAGGLAIGGAIGAAVGGGGSDDGQGGGGGGGGGGGSTKPIKIGHPLPLTGNAAADGEASKRGTTLAVEEVNKRGGIGGRKVEQHFADVGDFAPDKIKAAFTKLTAEDNVDAIVTNYFYAPGPDMEIVADAEIPYFHHSAQSTYSNAVKDNPDKYWMVFHGTAWEYPHGKGLIPVLKQIEAEGTWKPRNKKIFIISADNTYSTNIAKIMRDSIKKEGWTVVGFEQIVSPFTEWGPILEKIRRTDPDLAFNTDFAVGDLAAFQNQFVENPTNTLSFGQFGPGLPEYYELTGKNSTGVLWATVKGLLRDKIGSDFAQRFNTRWKAKPGLTTEAIVYDSMNIYFDAVSRANGPEDRRKVCDEIRNIVWRGVCGPSTFNNNRQTTPSYPTEEKDPSLGTPHLYIQLRDGKQEILSPSTYATSKFELPAWFS